LGSYIQIILLHRFTGALCPDGPGPLRFRVQVYCYMVSGQQLSDFFRPFDQAEMIAVEIVFISEIICFLYIPDSVKIEMIDE
jgi:hypothetical protein